MFPIKCLHCNVVKKTFDKHSRAIQMLLLKTFIKYFTIAQETEVGLYKIAEEMKVMLEMCFSLGVFGHHGCQSCPKTVTLCVQ